MIVQTMFYVTWLLNLAILPILSQARIINWSGF
jgi:hypothetical protein